MEIVHVFNSERIKAPRLFGGKGLVVKALPCEGVKVYKLAVASIFKVLRFYGVEALNFEGLLRLCGSTTRRFISVEEP